MKERRCCVHARGTPRCKNPYFISLRVQVVHPATFRKTWNRWDFCQPHFKQFTKTGGKGWSRWYGGSKREDAPVITYEEVPVL